MTPEDTLVVQFLKCGLPMGYGSPIPTHTIGNHSSATQCSKDLRAYITKEVEHGAMLGPFSAPPPILPLVLNKTIVDQAEEIFSGTESHNGSVMSLHLGLNII